VNPHCGTVKIAIYSSKKKNPHQKFLMAPLQIASGPDFDAFRRAERGAHSTQHQK